MKVILLEKIRNLGNLGDVVSVKAGYGRNYLMPYGKAIPATKENIAKIETRREELEKAEAALLETAKKRAEQVNNLNVLIKAKITEEEGGKLFGSIGVREIAQAVKDHGFDIEKKEINLPKGPIKTIGEYNIEVQLHGDVKAIVKLKVEPEE